jgi:hypothetical protein
MDHGDLQIGDVFRWRHDERPIRVLVCNIGVVMYDGWWPHLDSWGLADVAAVRRRRVHYYVTLATTLHKYATFLRSEPLSEQELALHRPDLPFAVVQQRDLSWTDDHIDASVVDGRGLQTTQVYVAPFGPNGGLKPGVRLTADDSVAFTSAELVRKAQAAQRPNLRGTVPAAGIGLYRLGLTRSVPSYYLWGAASQLHPDNGSGV